MEPPHSVLIVDDEPQILASTVRLLKKAGYTVFEAESGQQALDLAKKHVPDLILLDIVMPNLDGLEVCKRLKEDDTTKGIFVSIFSGRRIQSTDQTEGLEVGADDYIVRPIDNRELLARVKANLRLKETEKELQRHRNQLETMVEQRTAELKNEIRKTRQKEEAFIESEVKYRSLIKEMGNGFALHEIVCDESGKPCDYAFLEVNQAFEKITGLKEPDIIGKTVLEVLPKTENYWIEAYGKVALTGKPARFENFSTEFDEYFEVLAFSPKKNQFATVFTDITSRRKAEMRLLENEAKLKTLIRNIPGMVYSSGPNWTAEYFSGCREISGYGIQELNSKEKGWLDIVYPDDLERVAKKGQELSSQSNSIADSYRIITKNGDIKWVEDYKTSVYSDEGEFLGIDGVLFDVTARKTIELRLRESEEKYRSMMESMDEAAYICSSDFIIEYMNPAMIAKIGWDATGEKCYEILHKLDERCPWCVQERVIKGENIKMDLDKPEEGINFAISHSPIFHPNGSVSKLSIYRDITEQKRMEARIRQTQKMESIGNLAGGIAHEFNNILFSILGFTELALEDVEKDTILEDSLEEIYVAGNRAKDLVAQILAFARQSEVKIKPIRIDSVIKDVLQMIKSTIPATIEIRENLNSGSLIMGDRTQCHQLILNLCTNSAQAMENEGGILRVGLQDIDIDANFEVENVSLTPGAYIEISVSDTGVGIGPDIVDSIFDPYFTTKGPGEGTGMGLAVVHGIVESSGGQITVESSIGEGTTFKVYMPITSKRTSASRCDERELPRGKERILLVDDEAPIVKMGGQTLTRLGYTVTTRTSSKDALELFRSKPNEFDLIITDMTMPDITGDVLASKLMEIRPEIPIILFTGYSKKISDETAVELGIKAFAYKPIVKEDLARTVRKVLDGDLKIVGHDFSSTGETFPQPDN